MNEPGRPMVSALASLPSDCLRVQDELEIIIVSFKKLFIQYE
jgi:hypothetical protein